MLRDSLILAAAILLAPMARAQSPLLTPADIEKATGLTGVTLLPQGLQPKGNFSFARADGTGLLGVVFLDVASFEYGKKPVEIMVGGTKITTDLFFAAVTGVGDDAYDGPNEDPPFILSVRVGSRAFSLVRFNSQQHGRLSPAQTRAIANILAAHLR